MIRVKIPLHVSGLWIPYFGRNHYESGSRGAGLNLEVFLESISYRYSDKPSLIINGVKKLDDHALYISHKAGKTITLELHTPIPLGSGFGVSAAASIAYAIVSCNTEEVHRCIDYAHEAEIVFKTGLGDVVAETYGGFIIRDKPGSPSRAGVIKISLNYRPRLLACYSEPNEYTPDMLNRVKNEDYAYAESLLNKLISDQSLESFFEYANSFTQRIFSYAFIDEVLSKFKSSIIGYYMKKKALIIWVEDSYDTNLKIDLFKKGFVCIETSISPEGVRIVHTS